ncbi:MAG: hypothetical protein AAB445_03310 [Patescibacteria group bacterium]
MSSEIRGYNPTEESPIATPGTDFTAAGRMRERRAVEELLDETEQFQKVLGLFGTEEARKKFVWLCEKYVENYHTSSSSGSENHNVKHQNIKRDQADRSHYHNQIMEILRKLIVPHKTGSENWKILSHFQDRTVVEHVLLQGNWKE